MPSDTVTVAPCHVIFVQSHRTYNTERAVLYTSDLSRQSRCVAVGVTDALASAGVSNRQSRVCAGRAWGLSVPSAPRFCGHETPLESKALNKHVLSSRAAQGQTEARTVPTRGPSQRQPVETWATSWDVTLCHVFKNFTSE